ncbi:MAG: MarC family protein [Candidatus Brocadia sp. BROELEC01]|nr:MAG: MarC family protein [Candidatus Brocadia sp. BROELEC01]
MLKIFQKTKWYSPVYSRGLFIVARRILSMKERLFFPGAIMIVFLSLMPPAIAETTSFSQFRSIASDNQQTGYILDLFGIFSFFFLMLGPMKILALFAQITRDTDTKFRRKLALTASLVSTTACLAAAFLGQRSMRSLHISPPAILLAGGIILFLVALQMIMQMYSTSSRGEKTPSPPTLALAVSPLSFPTIVTPYGIAILIILMAAAQECTRQLGILGILLGIMVLNFLAMLFAHKIVKFVGFVITLQILGSVLGVLQVALGIQMILQALIRMGVPISW